MKTLIEILLPDVKAWTGGSYRHKSLGKYFHVPVEPPLTIQETKDKVLRVIRHSEFTDVVFDKLIEEGFTGCDFLLTKAQFHELAVAEFASWIATAGGLPAPGGLVNHVTGNRFHRWALKGQLVLGIRFWVEDMMEDNQWKVEFGWRVRVERMDQQKLKVSKIRQEAAQSIAQSHEVYTELEIGEPDAGETEKVRQRVRSEE